MLSGLSIRNILLIEALELDVPAGLVVLTGETGAGKSILLDALGFVLGWQPGTGLLRAGATEGEATAVFATKPGSAVHGILAEAGLPAAEGGELFLRRSLSAEGRSTAFVNDRRCSAEILRRLSETLVEAHGQHDDRGLMDARGHRALLDAFGRLDGPLSAVRAAWAARQAAARALAEAEAKLAEARRDEAFLRHAVAELDALDPQPGEDEALDAERRLMQAAERILADVDKAGQALGPEGAEAQMADAARWIEAAAPRAEGRLDAAADALSRALDELAAAQAGIADCLDALRFDPSARERVEERLFAIRAAARKHAVAPAELGVLAERLRGDLARVERAEGDIGRLRDAAGEAEEGYARAAAELTGARAGACRALDQAIAGELAPLKLDRARFETRMTPADPGPEGADSVNFQVATNPGAPSGPLDRIASGGELSRFLLALKVCLAAGGDSPTMIFDEIDRGVGGATANAVGKRLARLAVGGQVILVTHSPQVAAFGTCHWRIEKRIEAEVTRTEVRVLDAPARKAEIARMLAGESVTPAAAAAAEALLSAEQG